MTSIYPVKPKAMGVALPHLTPLGDHRWAVHPNGRGTKPKLEYFNRGFAMNGAQRMFWRDVHRVHRLMYAA